MDLMPRPDAVAELAIRSLFGEQRAILLGGVLACCWLCTVVVYPALLTLRHATIFVEDGTLGLGASGLVPKEHSIEFIRPVFSGADCASLLATRHGIF